MKYALITGGTKGIGKSITLSLLIEGYTVIVNYSSDDNAANNLQNELAPEYSSCIRFLKADLSSSMYLNDFFEKVKKITSTLDVLVLNTGITDRTNFSEIEIESWNKVIETNLTVPFFLIQKLCKIMPSKSSIIFTGSLMGIQPHSFSLSYGVTKAAVHSLVKNMVKFLQSYSIRINAVAPGFVDTDWQKKKAPELRRTIEQKISLNRFCQPEEIADACLFLIKNQYINGEILTIDGGYNFK